MSNTCENCCAERVCAGNCDTDTRPTRGQVLFQAALQVLVSPVFQEPVFSAEKGRPLTDSELAFEAAEGLLQEAERRGAAYWRET